MASLHPDLVREVRAAMAARGLTRTAFGIQALRDPRFVFDLESGVRECLPSTVARVRHFIATGKAAEPRARTKPREAAPLPGDAA